MTISPDARLKIPTDSREIYLPEKSESYRSFEIYHQGFGHYQNIVHAPHYFQLIEDVYHQVTHVSNTTAPRGLALILSILSASSLLEPLIGKLEEVIPLLKIRLEVCARYIRSSMDCLEQHRRRMDHTIENVQAMLILQFTINHIEAFSPRYRTLLTEAVMVAQHLGLHQVDSRSNREAQTHEVEDVVSREIKRRVWWYLAATDWLVSTAEGMNRTRVFFLSFSQASELT